MSDEDDYLAGLTGGTLDRVPEWRLDAIERTPFNLCMTREAVTEMKLLVHEIKTRRAYDHNSMRIALRAWLAARGDPDGQTQADAILEFEKWWGGR